MISARIRAQLPAGIWVSDVSQAFPDATFRLLSGVRADETAIELGEATGKQPSSIGDAIVAHDSTVTFDPLERTEDRLLAKYETKDTVLYELVAASSLPVEYPVVVQDGWYELDITGTRTEFEQLRELLEASGRPYELLSLVHGVATTELLTGRQQEVLDTALREGYYQVPRDCTLADVAETLDVNKATVSRILRRGESQLVTRFLTASNQP